MTFDKILILVLLASNGYASVVDLGVVGASYPVVEKDALTEIESMAQGVTIQEFIDKDEAEKKIKNFRPATTLLPRAQETREFLVDITYTLAFDIPDQHGNIIYPKGYRFNPLAYYTVSKTYVVLDGEDQAQIDWYKSSPYMNNVSAMLMITRGSYADLTEELKRPVFYALESVTERFQLAHAPSIVWQEGHYLRVKEVVCTEIKHPSSSNPKPKEEK